MILCIQLGKFNSGPAYLTFLLCLFYVLCCFVIMFDKPNLPAQKLNTVLLWTGSQQNVFWPPKKKINICVSVRCI